MTTPTPEHTTDLSDDEIKMRWLSACRLHGKGSLARRIAMIEVEKLEAAGVTELDINRLFPLTPTQLWLRDNYIEPGDTK